MKVFLSKYKWKLLLAFAIFIVAIPFGINSLFKLTSPSDIFIAEWGAGDALAFYGVMLASATSIIGVYISIEYAQRNYRIDEINRVKPYFALTHCNSQSKLNPSALFNSGGVETNTDEKNQNVFTCEEYRLKEIYIVIEQTTITFRERLSNAQRQRLESDRIGLCKRGEGCQPFKAHSLIYMTFEVENVGNGAATNTKIAFYKKGEERMGVSLYTVKKGDLFKFHIFCDDENIVKGNDYVIELIYGDIIGNDYSQKYPVAFDEDAETKWFCTTVDLSGKQELTDMNTEENENG